MAEQESPWKHWLFTQVWPVGQVPQVPPQPLLPQVLPVQSGTQEATHTPFWHVFPVGHVPQVPPQPSGPQVLPVHDGVQPQPPQALHASTHCGPQLELQHSGNFWQTHDWQEQLLQPGSGLGVHPLVQVPQSSEQVLHDSLAESQMPSPQTVRGWQRPSGEQRVPDGHEPQLPPQPSFPHCFPVQRGWQGQTHLLLMHS